MFGKLNVDEKKIIMNEIQVARQRKAYYEMIQTAVEDSFERCTQVAQRHSIIVHIQNAFRCVTRHVIAVLGKRKKIRRVVFLLFYEFSFINNYTGRSITLFTTT